jgi:hypothetical protein
VPDRAATSRRRFGRREGLQAPCANPHNYTVLNIPTATLYVSIATLSVTGYIAWQQWQTAKNKFRLDLFDRRFPVFEAAMKLASIAVQKGDVSDEARREFLIATRGVKFLFNQKLQSYCDTLAKEAVSLHVGQQLINLPAGDERANSAEHKKSIDAWGERVQWFNQQVDEIPRMFGPFLRVRG